MTRELPAITRNDRVKYVTSGGSYPAGRVILVRGAWCVVEWEDDMATDEFIGDLRKVEA
jgi:hypothetical protein